MVAIGYFLLLIVEWECPLSNIPLGKSNTWDTSIWPIFLEWDVYCLM